MTHPNHILVVDDEAGIRELLREILQDEGYQVSLAENASMARSMRQQLRPDLVLLDIWMPDSDGISLLKEWASSGMLTMPVIMMSGHGTIDTAVEATKIGAFDFLEKPITLQKLLHTVGRALKKSEQNSNKEINLSQLGKSPIIEDLKKRLQKVAALKTPLLLVAEEGAGAEICARFVCTPQAPWVALETESQLLEQQLDLLARVREGVLFINEVAALTQAAQKVLQRLMPRLEKNNARLVCATQKNLRELVEAGKFESELYQQLSGLTLGVPSLREHPEDICYLAVILLSQLAERKETPAKRFTAGTLDMLRNESWPGNLHQLQSVVKTLARTSLGEEITEGDLQRVLAQFGNTPAPASAPAHPWSLDLPLREARDIFERIYFEHHIAKSASNMSRVAEKVGLERTHLYRKLKQLGIKTKKME